MPTSIISHNNSKKLKNKILKNTFENLPMRLQDKLESERQKRLENKKPLNEALFK